MDTRLNDLAHSRECADLLRLIASNRSGGHPPTMAERVLALAILDGGFRQPPRWVSVEDRLPDLCTPVLLTDCARPLGHHFGGRRAIGQRVEYPDVDLPMWWADTGLALHFTPTHWQPIDSAPEPADDG